MVSNVGHIYGKFISRTIHLDPVYKINNTIWKELQERSTKIKINKHNK